MSAMVSVKNLADSSAPTDEEKKMLKKAMKLISDFSESVYARLGESYKRSIRNKASLNTLRLVSRNNVTPHNDSSKMEDVVDKDILKEIIEQSADIDCAGCERTDCKNCTFYKIKTYLNYDGKHEDNDLCPFRKDKQRFEVDGIKFDF